MILRLQHIGIVVRDLRDACARFERVLGMPACDFRDDQGQGMQLDARILLGNECWLHLVQNWNRETRVSRFLRERGEGLEHICIETDSIEADVAHLRDIGVGVWEDRILDANDGYEAFVYPDRLPGLTVELIESHDRSWVYPPQAVGEPMSTSMRFTRLHHVGLCVNDLDDARRRFERYFGLAARDFAEDEGMSMREAYIHFGNRCSLQLLEGRDPASRAGRFLRERGEGLEHIALETSDLEADVAGLRARGVRILDDAVHRFDEGLAAFVHPDELPGMAVELVELF
ncbi:MAG: VOC family protein [Gemmatimonadota bacterium]|nr:VOC family protein [Gemmatimonadota bacterium]